MLKLNLKKRHLYSERSQHQERITQKYQIQKEKADYLFVSASENVAWLLNIRGQDNPNSPIPNCHLLLTKDKKFFFICEKKKLLK